MRDAIRVPRHVLVGFVLVGLSAVLWGSSAGAVRAFIDHTGSAPVVIGFAQAVLAAPLLVVAAAVVRAPWPPLRESVRAAALTGGLVSGFLLSYFTAIDLVGVTLASVVAICSAPLFTSVLAVAFLRERPTSGMLAALGLGLVGTALVLTAGGAGGADGGPLGIGLALVAGLCFGAENVVVRRLVRRIDPTRLAVLTTIAMLLFLAPPALLHGGVVRGSLDGWPWLLYLAVFPTAMAPAVHNAGLRRIEAIPASIIGLLEPLTAAAIGLLVFHEVLGPRGAAGAVLLVFALVLLYATQRRAEPVPALEGVPASAGAPELQER